jgi:hypothetical protein
VTQVEATPEPAQQLGGPSATITFTGMPGHGKAQVQGTSENWWSRVARGYGLVRGRSGIERCKPGIVGEPVYSD